ncbi:MAG: nucleoside triphosphate pyrophosphohydrolase [Kosmotoga sp.]|uniref:nucleoside triphosphate pyrophosphohydrolase n=1 Tax=Kosmotoga sp. TaxID=1955248 RepID=UPI0025BAA58E|nr:nucleoside triphosphate pyrophosphohydrolase [Kosmotoga sp.]MCD6159520.1 nucleoside triphosphate pyrophosphohydrolase [Kosmotoga sp.]
MDTGEKFERLIEIMQILRSETGCEWDRRQTHSTLKPYLIEEAYEVLNAIDKNDDEELIEELGDVLLQVVFHAQIASERGVFDISKIVDRLIDKLIRRHPHVFAKSEGYSYRQWEEIKASEKGKKMESVIGEINRALPALSLARRVQENASEVGFDWENNSGVREKIGEELKELEKALDSKDPEKIDEEFGDLLFSLVNLSRFLKVDPELSLRRSTEKFVNRFRAMESLIMEEGLKIEGLSLEELDTYWNKIKEIKEGDK